MKASRASFFTEAMGLLSSTGSPLAISRSIFRTCRLLIATLSPDTTWCQCSMRDGNWLWGLDGGTRTGTWHPVDT